MGLPRERAEMVNIGLSLPSDLITVFIMGSILISVLPQISKLMERDKRDNSKTVDIYVTWCVIILSGLMALLALILIIFTPQLWNTLNPSLLGDLRKQGLETEFIFFSRIVLISPLIFGIKSVLGAFLNIKKEFLVYSLEGVIYNIGFIFGLLFFYRWWGVYGIAAGSVFGMLLTMIAFLTDAIRHGFRFRIGWFPELGPILKQTLILYIPRLLIYSNIRMAERMITLLVPEADGQVSALQYALDIQGVFLGIAVSLATVFLPNLAQLLAGKGRELKFWSYLKKYLRVSLLISLVGVGLTIIFTPVLTWLIPILIPVSSDSPIVSLNSLIIELTFILALALPFLSINEIFSRYFTVMEYTWQPVVVSFSSNVITVVGSLFFREYYSPSMSVALGLLVSSLVLSLLGYLVFRYDQSRFKLSGGEAQEM
ncbi:MAG: hypothetical protein OHK0017_00130 [Patescibacteria group bacterium]